MRLLWCVGLPALTERTQNMEWNTIIHRHMTARRPSSDASLLAGRPENDDK